MGMSWQSLSPSCEEDKACQVQKRVCETERHSLTRRKFVADGKLIGYPDDAVRNAGIIDLNDPTHPSYDYKAACDLSGLLDPRCTPRLTVDQVSAAGENITIPGFYLDSW